MLLMVIINTRIKTNAVSVDKYGEFFFRGLFKQGDQVKERPEFLLDKWTAKNLAYVRKKQGKTEFEK